MTSPSDTAPLGLLCLDTHFAKPPGHIRCTGSLPFPVRKAVVKGTTIAELLERPSLEFFAPFLDAARELEQAGCAAITGSCGFMALYQRELAEQVSIPVFSSSLIQIPLMHQMAGRRGRVGVITARASALTPAHFAAVGAGETPVAVIGMEDKPEFSEVILQNKRTQIDEEKLTAELAAAGRQMLEVAPDVTSVVLECTDLPPYAHALQAAIGLPVADLTTLATMVHEITARGAYEGRVQYD
ncbi:aspartate/glutamate racemase family protein [Leisingera sp. McT4-56]|uniref:aspartate/glutamate racemase family protein n=1 Tax=Leisingera sp. McT4-56 TaxID=2881255 RepID=UPI001CF8E15B|nr:aspartate/glutamate racemase family protein [Leisingera sp. McT4-56]MCB4458378.1 aspartate/glutamate racemase family protein [Leisingera sp. McT4-56]